MRGWGLAIAGTIASMVASACAGARPATTPWGLSPAALGDCDRRRELLPRDAAGGAAHRRPGADRGRQPISVCPERENSNRVFRPATRSTSSSTTSPRPATSRSRWDGARGTSRCRRPWGSSRPRRAKPRSCAWRTGTRRVASKSGASARRPKPTTIRRRSGTARRPGRAPSGSCTSASSIVRGIRSTGGGATRLTVPTIERRSASLRSGPARRSSIRPSSIHRRGTRRAGSSSCAARKGPLLWYSGETGSLDGFLVADGNLHLVLGRGGWEQQYRQVTITPTAGCGRARSIRPGPLGPGPLAHACVAAGADRSVTLSLPTGQRANSSPRRRAAC